MEEDEDMGAGAVGGEHFDNVGVGSKVGGGRGGGEGAGLDVEDVDQDADLREERGGLRSEVGFGEGVLPGKEGVRREGLCSDS